MHLDGPEIAGVAPCLLKREHRDVGDCDEEYAFAVELVCPPTRPDFATAPGLVLRGLGLLVSAVGA
jgi:hypothetical protein